MANFSERLSAVLDEFRDPVEKNIKDLIVEISAYFTTDTSQEKLLRLTTTIIDFKKVYEVNNNDVASSSQTNMSTTVSTSSTLVSQRDQLIETFRVVREFTSSMSMELEDRKRRLLDLVSRLEECAIGLIDQLQVVHNDLNKRVQCLLQGDRTQRDELNNVQTELQDRVKRNDDQDHQMNELKCQFTTALQSIQVLIDIERGRERYGILRDITTEPYIRICSTMRSDGVPSPQQKLIFLYQVNLFVELEQRHPYLAYLIQNCAADYHMSPNILFRILKEKLKSNDECHAIADITKYVRDLQQPGQQPPNGPINYQLTNFVTSTTKPDLLPLFDVEETNDLNYLFSLTCSRIARDESDINGSPLSQATTQQFDVGQPVRIYYYHDNKYYNGAIRSSMGSMSIVRFSNRNYQDMRTNNKFIFSRQ